jgi:hypothetical protein
MLLGPNKEANHDPVQTVNVFNTKLNCQLPTRPIPEAQFYKLFDKVTETSNYEYQISEAQRTEYLDRMIRRSLKRVSNYNKL